MSAIYPFAALRPTPKAAGRWRRFPTMSSTATKLGRWPLAIPELPPRVAAQIDMRAGADPHSDAAYQQAASAFATLRSEAPLVVEEVPSFYVYRLQMGNHVQAGIAACFSIDEYDRDLIKKHEKTRPDKEDDRTRHMLAIGAQTGPVFLTYRASKSVDEVVARVVGRRAAVRLHRAGRRAPRGVAGAGRREPGDRRCVRDRSTRSTSPMAIIAPRRAARTRRSLAVEGRRRARSRAGGRVSRQPDAGACPTTASSGISTA